MDPASDGHRHKYPSTVETPIQNLFNMTVDGPNFLGRLHDAGMQILLRPDEDGRSLLPVLPHFLKQLHFPIHIGYTALFPVNLGKLKMR